MSLVVTEAVVLHSFDYLESSRILRLATRELGVQSVVARGARRPRSRFGSSLDVFASGVAMYHAQPGRELFNLSGFDVTQSRMALAGSLERFAAASSLVELALRCSHADPHDEAFEVLSNSLDSLLHTPPGQASDVGLAVMWRYVFALGFGPAIDVCCACHAEVPLDRAAIFNADRGGVLCERCAARAPGGRMLPGNARDTLRQWLRGDAVPLAGDAERRAHRRLLREFLYHHLVDSGALRALEAWESLAPARL